VRQPARVICRRIAPFRLLILATIAMTYALIVLGGVVRVTGSGMGCGPDWPLCDGQVVPAMSFETALEYSHRVIASVVLLLTGMLTVAGWRRRSVNRWWLVLPAVAFGMVLVQAALGAITVFLDLHATVTALHHALALAFIALLVVLGIIVVRPGATHDRVHDRYQAATLLSAVLLTAMMLVYLTMVVGAYTATTGSGYACPEWPLCGDHVLPFSEAFHINVQLMHRWLAAASAVAIVVVAVLSRRSQSEGIFLSLTDAATVLIAIQVMLGAVNIWTRLSSWVVAAHLAVGTLLFGVLVAAVTLDRMARAYPVDDMAVAPHSGAQATGD
jgi:heme A synthase